MTGFFNLLLSGIQLKIMTLKKIGLLLFLAILVFGIFAVWRIFGSNTAFDEKKKEKAIYIRQGTNFVELQVNLDTNGVVTNTRTFALVAKLLKYPENIKPGRYVIKEGASIYSILKQLKSGNQTPVNLVINKLRTKEDLARKIAANFDSDSLSIIRFLYDADSLKKYNLDTNTVMTAIIPNTYSLLWTTDFPKLFKRLVSEKDKFWTTERKEKAKNLGLTPEQVYSMASIVEEETNMADDKGKIASVYLNRIDLGMPLQADPTVKYAMRDFGLKRIYQKHLSVQSPYNTYINRGLPPGPICTPSQKTIDAVLNAPATNYIYFVAKPDFRGYSNFASTYQEHLQFAKAYQLALDTLMRKRNGG